MHATIKLRLRSAQKGLLMLGAEKCLRKTCICCLSDGEGGGVRGRGGKVGGESVEPEEHRQVREGGGGGEEGPAVPVGRREGEEWEGLGGQRQSAVGPSEG